MDSRSKLRGIPKDQTLLSLTVASYKWTKHKGAKTLKLFSLLGNNEPCYLGRVILVVEYLTNMYSFTDKYFFGLILNVGRVTLV